MPTAVCGMSAVSRIPASTPASSSTRWISAMTSASAAPGDAEATTTGGPVITGQGCEHDRLRHLAGRHQRRFHLWREHRTTRSPQQAGDPAQDPVLTPVTRDIAGPVPAAVERRRRRRFVSGVPRARVRRTCHDLTDPRQSRIDGHQIHFHAGYRAHAALGLQHVLHVAENDAELDRAVDPSDASTSCS